MWSAAMVKATGVLGLYLLSTSNLLWFFIQDVLIFSPLVYGLEVKMAKTKK